MASYRLSEAAKEDLKRIYRRGVREYGEAEADRYFDAFFQRFASRIRSATLRPDRAAAARLEPACGRSARLPIQSIRPRIAECCRSYYPIEMEGISIKLPAALRRRLAAEAKRRNMTQSAIVRESVEWALAGSSGKRQRPSCKELVGDLVGSVRSGRSDLATNKALLEGVMVENGRRAAKRNR